MTIENSLDKDFLDYSTIDDEVKERLVSIRNQNLGLTVVDMFDPGEPYSHFVGRMAKFMGKLTGSDVEIKHYSEVGVPEGVTVFSGKFRNFDSYDASEFDDKFGHLLDLINETDNPILGLCAGHQLYGIANNSSVVDVNDDGSAECGLLNIIEQTNHPLFQNMPEKYHLWFNHTQMVLPGSSKMKTIGYSRKKDHVIPQMFDHFDEERPEKHIITFQSHPEKIFNFQREQEDYSAGVILLTNALALMHRSDYAKTKSKLYS